MVHAQTPGLVQRKENTGQKDLVFFLERERKTVDDGSKNLQKLGDTIESLRFVCELEKDIVDRSADE